MAVGCGFLSNSPLTILKFAAFAVMDAGDNNGNYENNRKNNTKNKPKWANDNILFSSGDSVIEIDCLSNFKDT